jgi:hypothetical protein
MVRRFQGIRPREDLGELRRIVDQDGKVLRTDESSRPLVLEGDQRDILRISLADHTGRSVVRHHRLERPAASSE